MTIPRRKPYFHSGIIFKFIRFLGNKNKNLETKKLEQDLSDKLGIPNPVIVESGRIGFYLILKTSNLKKGSEIIMPSLTFGLMKNVIKKSGFKPVPVDSDINSFQMSPLEVEKAINPKTGAILATHIFGGACDVGKLKTISRKYNLLLIEDCAESMGTTVGKELTGTIGDIGFSSFNVAKPLQGIYGGVVFGKDKKRTDLIRSIINDSAEASKISIKEVVRSLGGVLLSRTIFWPALMYVTSLPKVQKMFVYYYRVAENKQMIIRKMSPYLAFVVRANIPSFRKRIAQRQKVASSYVKKLSKYMTFQKNSVESKANGYMVVVNFPGNTLELRRYLALRGIDIAVKDEVVDDCLGRSGSNTKNLVNHLVSLPVYESLKEGDINRISRSILSFVAKGQVSFGGYKL